MNTAKIRNQEYIARYTFVLVAFAFSFFHKYTAIIWLVGFSFLYTLKYKKEGAIECLLFIAIRTVMNPELAVNIGDAGTIKWLVIFLLSFYLLISTNIKIDNLILVFLIFAGYLVVSSFFVSSYPLVAMLKVVSYIIPFLAILSGIKNTKEIQWIKRLYYIMLPLMIGSVLVIPLPLAYARNGVALQGLFNQPNMFGILWVLFFAMYLHIKPNTVSWKFLAFIIFGFISVVLSKSRTSLFGMLLLLVLYICMFPTSIGNRIATLGLLMISCLLVIVISDTILSSVIEFIYKGGDSIFSSRKGVLNRNWERFKENPLLGTGFNVPYKKGVKSYEFSFDLLTENGNIISALLGDMGIIGTLLFVFCYGYLFRKGKNRSVCLFAAPFLISMGEMVFFSTNSIAIILYILFACYLYEEKPEENRLYETAYYGKYSVAVSG